MQPIAAPLQPPCSPLAARIPLRAVTSPQTPLHPLTGGDGNEAASPFAPASPLVETGEDDIGDDEAEGEEEEEEDPRPYGGWRWSVSHHAWVGAAACSNDGQSAPLGSAPARFLHLLRARLVSPCSSALPRAWPPPQLLELAASKTADSTAFDLALQAPPA